ncbi:MAG TPA: putative sulfate exporter family transporter [Lautropia sp.]|nr:putative sulfate exporter family transporter [Lautropia sp.]
MPAEQLKDAERRQFASGIRELLPGVLLSATLALAAGFVSDHHGGPQLLYALFFGMAFNFMAADPRITRGLQFSSTTVLRVGVALLGARISIEQIESLGVPTLLLVLLSVTMTVTFGLLLARLLGRSSTEGLLTGGAVAICGASAALAIAAVLPRTEENRRFTLLTVVGVTSLSTIAMVSYPSFAHLLNLEDIATGIFFGSTIHDVAQVVGAGYLRSAQTGDAATLVKLFRVMLLVPVVMVIALTARREAEVSGGRAPVLPLFLVMFIVLLAINSAGWVPAALGDALSGVSRWCLVVAIAALGVRTSLQQFAELGWRPMALMIGETAFLALLVVSMLVMLR